VCPGPPGRHRPPKSQATKRTDDANQDLGHLRQPRRSGSVRGGIPGAARAGRGATWLAANRERKGVARKRTVRQRRRIARSTSISTTTTPRVKRSRLQRAALFSRTSSRWRPEAYGFCSRISRSREAVLRWPCVRALRVPGPRNPPDGHLVHGAREVVRLATALLGRQKRGIRPCHQSRRRPDGAGAARDQSGRGGGRRQYHAGPRRRPKNRAESGQLGYRSMTEAISLD
jgi:hypothetical protein